MTNKEISERATAALHLFETSKPHEISTYDLVQKTNEALRLIKELSQKVDELSSVVHVANYAVFESAQKNGK